MLSKLFSRTDAASALKLYYLQLGLNFGWTPLFFVAKRVSKCIWMLRFSTNWLVRVAWISSHWHYRAHWNGRISYCTRPLFSYLDFAEFSYRNFCMVLRKVFRHTCLHRIAFGWATLPTWTRAYGGRTERGKFQRSTKDWTLHYAINRHSYNTCIIKQMYTSDCHLYYLPTMPNPELRAEAVGWCPN